LTVIILTLVDGTLTIAVLRLPHRHRGQTHTCAWRAQ